MTDCLISFGSNLGNSRQIVLEAATFLESDQHVSQLQTSELLQTQPIGGPPDQPQFVNGAWRIQTSLPAADLLSLLHRIERQFGRERRVRWDSRSLDLDLLLYGDQIISATDCTIPHPRMSFRRFVLQPAVPIAGEMSHPICQTSLSNLLRCLDERRKAIQLIMSPSRQSVIGQRLQEWESEFKLGYFDFANSDSLRQENPAMLRVFDLVDQDKLSFLNERQDLFIEHQGPVLILEDASEEQVVTEIVAAIETMRIL